MTKIHFNHINSKTLCGRKIVYRKTPWTSKPDEVSCGNCLRKLDRPPLLKVKDTFKSADKTGDWVGVLMFCAKVSKNVRGPLTNYYIIFPDGGSDWFCEDELNIDKKTIKPYSTTCGIDFYGMHG